MHNYTDVFGTVLKLYRQKSGYTVEKLAEIIDVSERSIYSFESGDMKPKYDVLYRLIRVLSIEPDLIFYPEKKCEESEVENLIRMLYQCDERSLKVVKATVKALIDTADHKQLVHI